MLGLSLEAYDGIVSNGLSAVGHRSKSMRSCSKICSPNSSMLLPDHGLPGLISPAFGYAAAYFLAAMVACLDCLY